MKKKELLRWGNFYECKSYRNFWNKILADYDMSVNE